MKFIPFQSAYFDTSDVASVTHKGKAVTVNTRSRPWEHYFGFAMPEVAQGMAAEFVQRLNNSQSNNNNQHNEIMSKLSELASQLAAVEKNQDEANTEIVTKLGELTAEVEALKAQLGDVDLPADAAAGLERILTKSRGLADIIRNPEG